MNKEAVTGIKYARSCEPPRVAFASYTELNKMAASPVLDMYTASGDVALIIVLSASRAKRSPRSDPRSHTLCG
jgi:hypothetical protein